MTKTQKPCNSDQIRNDYTGRCIKISNYEKLYATTALVRQKTAKNWKPCAPGKVRSKTTHRCGNPPKTQKTKPTTPKKAQAQGQIQPQKRDWNTSTPVSDKTIRRMQTMLNNQLAKRKVSKNEKYISVFNQYRPGPNSPLLPPV
jgi:hypothetical protein